MANRVLFGLKGVDWGLWVSKPGYNVLTCTEDQMMFSSERKWLQVQQTGKINGAGPYTLAFTDPGYQPFILLTAPMTSDPYNEFGVQYLSATTVSLRWIRTYSGQDTPAYMNYAIFAIRRTG